MIMMSHYVNNDTRMGLLYFFVQIQIIWLV